MGDGIPSCDPDRHIYDLSCAFYARHEVAQKKTDGAAGGGGHVSIPGLSLPPNCSPNLGE